MTWGLSKKLLVVFSMCFVFPRATFAKGAPEQKGLYDFSKGLDSYHSSLSLPDGFVQGSLNGFFDARSPFEKRQGYTVVFSTKSYAFQQAWTYTDQTNTTWIIVRSSDALIANNLSGSISVKIATVSVNNLVGETNAFGNAYFVDQSQGVYYWNGVSTASVSGSPFGSIITQFHNRLWVTGAAAPNGNQLYGSALYNGLLWTPNLNPNDPVQLTVGIQDNFDNITAIYVYLDTLYAFKHYSTFGLYGFDQTSFQVSQITQECGCVDGNSIQTFGGDLKFVSLRGVEDFNGYTCNRISDPVKNLIDPAISVGNISAQSWVQSQTADWLLGTISQLSTTTFSPALAFVNASTPIVNNSFDTGDFTGWTAGSDWRVVASSQGVTINQLAEVGPYFAADTAFCPYDNNSGITTCSGRTIPNGGQFQFNVSLVYSTSTATIISSGVFTTPGFGGWYLQTMAGSSNVLPGTSVKLNYWDDNNNFLTSNSFFASSIPIQFFLGQDEPLGVNPTFNRGVSFYVDFVNPNISLATNYSSGTFKSQIHQIPSISSWGNFSASDILSGGGDAISFSICSSTNSNMSAPVSCSAQNMNSQIMVTTGTYVQWYATFTVTGATQTPTLNSGTVQWFTGNRATPMASTIWDNRYWLSLTTTTTDTANDAVLVLGKTGAWSLMDIHAGGFTQYKNSLYHSDSKATGNVYLDNQGYSDNGSPINTYLFTKDYPMVNLAQDASIQAIYPTFSDQSNANISLSYFVDRNPTAFPLSSVNQLEYSNASSLKIPLGAGDGNNQVFGETFSFFVQQNDSNPMQFYGMRVLFSEREIQ